jgi:biopolymer transport protein ExbB
MQDSNRALVERIMAMPILQAEWVLWFLFALSIISLGIILERAFFFVRRSVDVDAIRARLQESFANGAFTETTRFLKAHDSLEANVLLGGLSAAEDGPDAVEELTRAAMSRERQRYERALTVLAVVGSNAPFVGLFGTVLGIIHAFASLSNAKAGASQAVMSGVSEALVATAVGLLVAIPAVSAFNFFKARIRSRTETADQLVRALLARLKSDVRPLSDRQKAAA